MLTLHWTSAGRNHMTKLHTLMIAGCMLASSPLASAKTVNLINSAELC